MLRPNRLARPRFLPVWMAAFGLLCSALPTLAHTTGETYVWLNVEESQITGRVEINLDDLREKLQIPIPEKLGEALADGVEDPRLVMLREKRSEVLEYVQRHFKISANDEPIAVEFTQLQVLDLPHDEGNYAQYFYVTPEGSVPDIVTIQNSLFVEDDFTHRSLVCIERNRKSGQEFEGEFAAMVFGSHNPVQELDLRHIDLLLRPRDFIWQGVLHIWIGIDHILFIVALLLPAVLVRKDGKWQPVDNFKQAFWNILKIVTVFTFAH
ncbi:MAG: HupE/UreJ family protein, partial [Planctomycetota bacterium]